MADAIDCGCDLGNRYQVYPNTGLTGVKKLSGYIVACQQISQVNLPYPQQRVLRWVKKKPANGCGP